MISATETHRLVTGMSERQLYAFLDANGVTNHGPLLVRWHELNFAAFRAELRAMAGIDAVLGAIGCRKCVASNSSLERLRKSLGVLDIWNHFAPHIYSAEHVANPEPASDLVEHCLRQFRARPERSMMVDDSVSGILTARKSGVAAIGFVDLNDPRPRREATLRKAGALTVAVGLNKLLTEIVKLADASRAHPALQL